MDLELLLMLAVSPLRNTNKDGNQEEMESFSMGSTTITTGDFGDLSEGNLLESINFDDFFVSINVDGDILPDLVMDPEMFAEFSVSYGEESEMNSSASLENNSKVEEKNSKKDYEDKTSCSGQGSEEIASKRDESVVVNPLLKDAGGKGRKSSSKSKNPQAKRKVKVYLNKETIEFYSC